MATDFLVYNKRLNCAAHIPFANTAIGLARVIVHTTSLSQHILIIGILFFQMQSNSNGYLNRSKQFHQIRAYIDMRAIIRGIIEFPPILGGLFSLYWDLHFLTPAQKLAYRIQEIHQTRLTHLNDIPQGSDEQLKELDLNNQKYKDVRYAEFIRFVNNQPVKISCDENKIGIFCRAFKNAEIRNEIFNDKKLPFYALAAFEKLEIDGSDMATIMEIYVAKQCFPDCSLGLLCDDNGNVTQETSEYLGFLEEGSSLAVPKRGIRIKFLEHLKKKPKCQRIFWHYEALLNQPDVIKIHRESQSNFGELSHCPIGSLYSSSVFIGGIKTSKNREISLSFSAERLFLNLKYNSTNNPLLPKLGTIQLEKVKKNIKRFRRLCRTFFPGITTTNNPLELPTSLLSHDKMHAHLLQWYSKIFLEDINKIRTLFEITTGIDDSEEVYKLLEMIFPYPHLIIPVDDKELLHKFIHFNSPYISSVKLNQLQVSELFWEEIDNGKNKPTVLTWIMLLNMNEASSEYNSKSSVTDLKGSKFGKLIEYANQNLFDDGDTLKQKIWKLQQLYQNPEGPIDAVSDDLLEFRKVTEGRRKNTVILIKKIN